MTIIGRIRRKILDGEYFLSSHAEQEEMPEDDLDRADVEHVLIHGSVKRKLTDDPRGTRYCVVGAAPDGRMIEVVVRFTATDQIVIITVYDVTESYDYDEDE